MVELSQIIINCHTFQHTISCNNDFQFADM